MTRTHANSTPLTRSALAPLVALWMSAAACVNPQGAPGVQLRELTRHTPVVETTTDPPPTEPIIPLDPPDGLRALPRPAPIQELSYQELIDPNRLIQGTMSVGTTSTGELRAGATLPLDGAHHKVMESCRERDTNYGTEELVTLIMHGGAEVNRQIPGSPPLVVCNMSREGGGDIAWSRSHNSGRDADLAFFALLNGKPVEAPSLLSFGSNLKAGAYTFDVPRNWALARGLLTHPTVQVQWLFISTPLREALLEYARAQGEPEELLAKAEEVLWQPTDSSPHNDHFHLRIYCPKQDRLDGCRDTGPTRAWVDTYEAAVEARVRSLLKGLRDPDPQTRVAVIEFMIRVHLPNAAVGLAERALFDPDPGVRLTALRALGFWRSDAPEVFAAMERAVRAPGGGVVQGDPGFEAPLPPGALRAEARGGDEVAVASLGAGGEQSEAQGRDAARTATVMRRLYSTMARIASRETLPLMKAAMASKRTIGDDPESAVPEARLAAEATEHVMSLELVEPLIALLDHEDGETRQAAARTLQRITNHTYKTRWERDMSQKRLRARQAKWERWWRENQGKGRDELLLAGFQDADRRLRKERSLESWKVVDRLVRLTKRDDHVGYNADRTLCRLLGRWSPRDADAEDKHKRWSKWWRKNKRRFKKRWG